MRILFVWSFYEVYLESFYQGSPGLGSEPYDTQYTALLNDFFGSPGSHVRNIQKLGHASKLIIHNCKPLQKKWAEENNFVFDEINWRYDIALEQIKQFNPDIVFVGLNFSYYDGFLNELIKISRKVFAWISCPIPKNIEFNKFDLILSSVPDLVNDFRQKGINSELLPAAFDATILNYLPVNAPQNIDFSFIGGIGNQHSKRILLLEEMVKHTPIKLFGYGYPTDSSWKSKLKKLLYPGTIAARYKGEVWGLGMYRTLMRSKITFNAHIDMALGNRVNMRMYEATGAGTLLLTDKSDKSDVEYFVDEKEVVTYSSAHDAAEKVKYYLKHEEERKKIALAGQARTLQEYNFENNTKKMLQYFEEYLN